MRRSWPISGPARSTEPAATAGTSALARRTAERARVVGEFFEQERGELARACHAMARAFARGGTLIPFGTGVAATDAAHAAVEFMHPVIVGKRALPAVAPSNDPTGLSTLSRLAGPDDIALAISHGGPDPLLDRFLAAARARGLLTISLTGTGTDGYGARGDQLPIEARYAEGGAPPPQYRFAVPSDDPAVVQEVQETAYHVLWELVHVFFEQPGLLDARSEEGPPIPQPEGERAEACITCGDAAVRVRVAEVQGPTAVIERDGVFEQVAIDLIEGVEAGDELLCHAGVAIERVSKSSAEPPRVEEPNRAGEPGGLGGDEDPAAFLYPFQSGEQPDLDSVLADVEASTLAKAGEVTALRSVIDLAAVERCAAALRERLESGGRLVAFGNGGSATDAQDLAADALARRHTAIALNNDAATVTAVANDVGFEQAFARQLIALGRPADAAIAITTSGSSPNLVAALEQAHGQGMLTVGVAGHDGGRLTGLDWLDHLFVVPSEHIPRIQEAQATIYHLLLKAIGEPRAGDGS